MVVAREVARNRGGLTYDRHSTGVRGRVARVLEGALRVIVKQPLHHDEVLSDVLSIGPSQPAQLPTRRGLQLRGLHTCRNRRLGDALVLGRPAAPTMATAPTRLAVLGTPAAIARSVVTVLTGPPILKTSARHLIPVDPRTSAAFAVTTEFTTAEALPATALSGRPERTAVTAGVAAPA